MFAVTPAAVGEFLRHLADEEGDEDCVRVTARTDGLPKYALDSEILRPDRLLPGDTALRFGDLGVLVTPESLENLQGTRLDYAPEGFGFSKG